MTQPKVSIVIPTFNRARLLPRAIDTALEQTVPCEVVVCDHGSTDETPSVVAKYGSRVRYIRKEKDNGPIACWRDGIEQSTGEFVHINFDDDWIDKTFIEETLRLMSPDVAFAYTRVKMHFQGTNTTGTILYHPPGVRPSSEIATFLVRNRLTISPGCALFRRADLLKNLLSEIPGANGIFGKNSGVGEDLLVFLLSTLDYPKYAHIPEPLAHFFAHPDSITVNAKISGKDLALKKAYGLAKQYYLGRSGSVKSVGWTSAIKWWWNCGIFNQVTASLAFVSRQIRFLLFRLKTRASV